MSLMLLLYNKNIGSGNDDSINIINSVLRGKRDVSLLSCYHPYNSYVVFIKYLHGKKYALSIENRRVMLFHIASDCNVKSRVPYSDMGYSLLTSQYLIVKKFSNFIIFTENVHHKQQKLCHFDFIFIIQLVSIFCSKEIGFCCRKCNKNFQSQKYEFPLKKCTSYSSVRT